jgi:hypothetical protein
MPADDRGKNLIMKNKNPLDPKDYCSKCECLWEDHDFGVPEPYCPGPIINQEAASESRRQLKKYYENKIEQLKNLINQEMRSYCKIIITKSEQRVSSEHLFKADLVLLESESAGESSYTVLKSRNGSLSQGAIYNDLNEILFIWKEF